MAWRTNRLDLDPTYRDHLGRPILRMTYDFTPQDLAMSEWVTDKAMQVAQGMGGKTVERNGRDAPYDSMPYQTTHNTGGTIMGATPGDSVINRYLQSWQVSNLFLMGPGAFPQNAGYNPTDTVGALTYWSAKAIVDDYLRAPGPMVDA